MCAVDSSLNRRQEVGILSPCTYLWVEWELHVGFLPEAELGEVIENCQEVIIWCHRILITDVQLQHILRGRERAQVWLPLLHWLLPRLQSAAS